jgi:hypothetical protein
MSASLADRLNQILPRITSEEFLSSEGIGNEIACYIFDYPAEDEPQVREHIQMMTSRMASHHSELSVLHLNVFDVILEYLKQRGLFDKAIAMQASKEDTAVLRALEGPLAAEKISEFIASEHAPKDVDLLLLSGVGSAWPMLRAHNLLNCLHPVMGNTPLVMFYPGNFDGTTLRLFGRIATTTSRPGTKPYYRAFTLVPGGTNA